MEQVITASAKVVREILPTIKPEEKKQGYKQLRVAAYCRVSTDSDEQEMSFEAQVGYYTDKIMRNPEWSLAGIYADEGISGTQAEKRKDFMRMIRQCRKGNIDLVITKSVSRFARNTVDCLNYVRELKALGIPIIFEKEGLNTMHATSEIYISMHGIFAQSESESLSGNVRMGKAISAKNGNVAISYKSFLGYRRGKDNKPEIDEEQAEIVRFIYERYLAGDSLQMIRDSLEEQHISTPMGKEKWQLTTIRSILTNEKYKGDALLQKTYIVDCISHKSKKNDDRPQYYVENNHPAIIPREMFDRVQEEMAHRTSKRKVKEIGTKTESGKYSSKYALTDLLICGHCGTPYRRCTWSRNGKKKIVWRCISRLDYGKKYCADSPSVEESVLQRAVAEGIRQVVMDESGQTALEALKLHIGMYFGQSDENSTAVDEIRMQELVQSITELAGAEDSGNRMTTLIDELNTVKQTIAEKKAKQSSAEQSERRIDEILTALDALKNHPIEYDNQAVRQIIECIKVLSAEQILIIFKDGLERTVQLTAE